jgi:hypothetical protein
VRRRGALVDSGIGKSFQKKRCLIFFAIARVRIATCGKLTIARG